MKARLALLLVATALVVAALAAARPAVTPGPFLRDFEAYWSAGSAWNERTDPYGRAIWQAERTVPGVASNRDELLPFVGPPASLLLWSAFARIAYPPAATLAWTALAVALLALVVLTLRGCDAVLSPIPCAAAAVLAVAFGPVTSDLALGQVALVAFLAATALAAGVPRSLPGGILAALAATLQPNVALALAARLGRNRTTLALAGGILAAYLLGAFAAGWSWPLAYARLLGAHAAAERFTAIQLGPAAIFYGLGAAPRAALLAGGAVAALALAAAVLAAIRVRHAFARFAAFAALTPFVAGFFHEHDLIVAYAATAWCGLHARGRTRTLAAIGTLLVAVDWLGLAQRPSGIAQSALLALAALCAFTALGASAALRPALAAAVPLAAIFATAAWLAASHPAPVWPDALAAFHAAPNASATAVWFAEQRAGGLLARVPVWAMLRSLSLLGCALLAYAIIRKAPEAA